MACGLATLDVVQVVESLPCANGKVVAQSTQVAAGGPALNAAATAAALGVETVLVSAVGDESLARVIRVDLDLAGVRLVDAAGAGFEVPLSTVIVTAATGDRAVVSRNAVGVDRYALDPAALAGEWLVGVGAVLVDGHHLPLAVALAREAHRRGIPVLLDGGSWKPGLPELLPFVDIAVVSSDFMTPNAARGAEVLPALIEWGPTWVARSAGPQPVTWRAASGAHGATTVPQVTVVDTLGAGDVLHGALLAHLAEHGMTDLPGALEQAVAVAARSVAAPGARGWTGTRSR